MGIAGMVVTAVAVVVSSVVVDDRICGESPWVGDVPLCCCCCWVAFAAVWRRVLCGDATGGVVLLPEGVEFWVFFFFAMLTDQESKWD